jgi:hypothetical protein
MVEKLDKKMIDEMKQMKHPPSGVKLVMEAVCIMKNVKPTPVRNALGRLEMDYWESSKKVLADLKFVQWFMTFNADNNLSDETIQKLQPHLKNRDFVPEVWTDGVIVVFALLLCVRMYTFVFLFCRSCRSIRWLPRTSAGGSTRLWSTSRR